VPGLTARVRSNARATPTTRLLTLDPLAQPFDFRAGQWARVGVDAPSARPYSIASAPSEVPGKGIQLLVREDGSGTELAAVRRGATVYLEGPHGRFGLPDEFFSWSNALFVAGGTGIAPIRAMLVEALGHPPHPACRLVYSARNTGEFAFLRELRRAASEGAITLALTATRQAHRRWKGLSTRVNRTLLETVIETPDTHAFVCGPEGFVTDVREALENLGVRLIRTEEQ
jgi:ferredoxin-NADP reductase